MKHAMLRWELTLRLTAACVVLAVALSQLTLARAEPQGRSANAAGGESGGYKFIAALHANGFANLADGRIAAMAVLRLHGSFRLGH